MAEDRNLALVDLFDRRHAKKVLALLGQAYGGLPASGSLRKEQDAFLNQAISELAEGDHVISVRLALFAQMFEGKAVETGDVEGDWRRHRGGRGVPRGIVRRPDCARGESPP